MEFDKREVKAVAYLYIRHQKTESEAAVMGFATVTEGGGPYYDPELEFDYFEFHPDLEVSFRCNIVQLYYILGREVADEIMTTLEERMLNP